MPRRDLTIMVGVSNRPVKDYFEGVKGVISNKNLTNVCDCHYFIFTTFAVVPRSPSEISFYNNRLALTTKIYPCLGLVFYLSHFQAVTRFSGLLQYIAPEF